MGGRLLATVLTMKRPELLPLVERVKARNLTPDQRDELIDVISDELIANGLAGDSPNAIGLSMEELIDFVNRSIVTTPGSH